MRISYLVERPELAAQLIPGLLEHWSYVFPHQTAAERAVKFKTHLDRDELPIAWIAHDGDTALGTAALRKSDLEGREDLSPWLGGVFVLPSYHGLGIASALCQIAEGKAHDQGVPRLYLFTHGQEALYVSVGPSLNRRCGTGTSARSCRRYRCHTRSRLPNKRFQLTARKARSGWQFHSTMNGSLCLAVGHRGDGTPYTMTK
jgi:GNAT superfamily N-acetyltransferase